MGTKPKTLAEFDQSFRKKRSGSPAWLETIPELDEVVEAWLGGVSAHTIRAWLIEECGYAPEQATRNRVYNRLHEKFPRS